MGAETVRWTIVVDKALDRDVRRHLAETGGRKGDLSLFVRNAIEVALFQKDWAGAKAHNADLSETELTELVDSAVAETRKTFWQGRKWWTEDDKPQ